MLIIGKDINKEREIVKKSNFIINQLYDLTKEEKMVLFYVMSHINPYDDKELYEYEVEVDRFCSYYSLDPSEKRDLYSTIKRTVNQLKNKELKIVEPDGVIETYWAPSVKYFNREKKFRIRLSNDLKPYFLNLKENFTSLPSATMKKLLKEKGDHLYEGLLSRMYKGKVIRLSLEEVRKFCDVKEDKYPLYANFKQRILKNYINKINQYSEIEITRFYEIKEGRKVVFIEFHVHRKEVNWIEEKPEIKTKLIDYGLKPEEIDSFLKNYDEKRIVKNIRYIENEYLEKGKSISSLRSLLKKAIEQDFYSQENETSPYEARLKQKKETKLQKNNFFMEVDAVKKWIIEESEKRFLVYKEKLGEEEFEKILDLIWESDDFKEKNSLMIADNDKKSLAARLLLIAEVKQKEAFISGKEIEEYLHQKYDDERFIKKLLEEINNR